MRKNNSVKIGYSAAILAVILAGSISTVAKPILLDIHPILLASLVCFLIALLTVPFTTRKKHATMNKKDWSLIGLISLFGAILAPLFFYAGLKQTTASDTSLLTNGEMIFTILLAVVLFKENLKPIGYVAVGIVVAGVIIVTTNLQFSDVSSNFKNLGNVLVLSAMAFWALDNNVSKIIIQKIDVSRTVQLKCLIAGVVLISLVFLLGIPINIKISQIPNILFLGIAGSGVSLLLFMYAIQTIGTVRTVLIVSTSAVFGLIFALVFLHEQIGIYQILAIIMMLFGIYLVEMKGQVTKSKK